MTLFEEKVNAYRENKRLMEELEAMNDAIKADIIAMERRIREIEMEIGKEMEELERLLGL